jgi:hypothetical protein
MASIIKVDQIQESTTGVGTNFSTTGSATTPTISIGNQTNKGFYHLATDKIGVAIGGQRVGEIGSGYGGFRNNICNFETITGTNDYTGSSGTITDLNYTYTPKFSNSKLIVQTEIIWNSTASASYPGLGIGFTYNNVFQRWFYYYTDRGGTIQWNTISTLTTTLSSISPISMSFTWTGASGTPTITIYGSSSNYNHYLRIMEIMQ